MKRDILYAVIFVIVAFVLAKLGQVIIFVWKYRLVGVIVYIMGWIILGVAIIIFGKETIDYLRKQGVKKLAKRLKKR